MLGNEVLSKEQLFDLFQQILDVKKFEHQLLYNAMQVGNHISKLASSVIILPSPHSYVKVCCCCGPLKVNPTEFPNKDDRYKILSICPK